MMTTHDQPEPQVQHDVAAEKLVSSTSSKNNGTQLMPMTARGEATRRRILDAAEEVFGEFGYYEASISEITRRAGIAQGTFYIYFRSKHEVFAEVVEDIGKRLRAATRAAIAEAPDRLEAERRGFAAFFEFVAAHHRIYQIVQEAERIAPEAAYSYYRGISQGYERALRAAMEAGTIRPMNPEAVTYALMGIGHFVALRWIVWPQQDSESSESTAGLPDEIFASVMDFIAHGLARRS
ncbi:MAG TPA: TetR/AcrR family transcriptional regulator [Ktedonobacteraceae bacterium]|nr:TetR/AcrR family transcriptional regulator [Ktedonobacteraceae bacterium]